MAVSHMAEQIGRVLGERYRLLSPLGSGMSAEVFLGDDVRLHRRVAVKVLRRPLAEDEAFLRRFRAEAQAAAALSHPSILAVYDWSGEDPPYLVTEYLTGGNLRSMLDAGHRLSPSQALLVGVQAAQALDVAHRQGFIHRDVKPANLLFDGEGRLRVADFGLARAVAEAAVTEPDGAVLGTARYASPEQVQGASLTGASDVYSLGLVLIEAVTGQVPFAADTTVGTLMARLDRAVPVPGEMGALGPVLERMGVVAPADRLDAAGVVSEMTAAASQMSRPAALPLVAPVPPRPGGVAGEDHTTVAGVVPAGAGAGPATAEQQVVPAAGGPSPVPESPPPAGAVPPVVPKRSAARRRVPGWVVPTLLTALALAVGAAGAWFLREASVPAHVVPKSLIGAQVGDLNNLVGDRGWRIEQQEEFADGTAPGEILRTRPEPGTELREGEELEVVVSRGPAPVALPQDLARVSQEDAEARLRDLGFEVDVRPVHHGEIPEGQVVGFGEGVGEEAPRGSTVPLLVSRGPRRLTVPPVQGMTWDEAKGALEAEGLKAQRREVGGRRRDRVIGTAPEEGTEVAPGTKVTVYVAGRGDGEGISVPILFGRSLEDAKEMLEQAGLEVGDVEGGGSLVRDQDPGGLEVVEEGTEVDLQTW